MLAYQRAIFGCDRLTGRQVHGSLEHRVARRAGLLLAAQIGGDDVKRSFLNLGPVAEVGHRAGIFGEMRDDRREGPAVGALEEPSELVFFHRAP